MPVHRSISPALKLNLCTKECETFSYYKNRQSIRVVGFYVFIISFVSVILDSNIHLSHCDCVRFP